MNYLTIVHLSDVTTKFGFEFKDGQKSLDFGNCCFRHEPIKLYTKKFELKKIV
jgi:hypothetical protein